LFLGNKLNCSGLNTDEAFSVFNFIYIVPNNVFVVARRFAEVVLPKFIFVHIWVVLSRRLVITVMIFFLFSTVFIVITYFILINVILVLDKILNLQSLLLHGINIIGNRLNVNNFSFLLILIHFYILRHFTKGPLILNNYTPP